MVQRGPEEPGDRVRRRHAALLKQPRRDESDPRRVGQRGRGGLVAGLVVPEQWWHDGFRARAAAAGCARRVATRRPPRNRCRAVPCSGTSRTARRADPRATWPCTAARALLIARSSSPAADAGSLWAAPTGSGTIVSTIPSRSMSGAVSLSASAASTLRPASRHRMAAHPSGRDDAVDRELLNQDPIADREAERAAAAPFPAHRHDDRRVEDGHLPEIVGDGLGDAPLLRLDARVGRRRVDDDDDRPAELLRELHRPDRLPVPFRLRVAEVPVDLLLGVGPALLVADDEHRLIVVPGHAGDDRVVVGESPVAVDLDELGEQPRHVVEHAGAVRMPGHLHALPGLQIRVDLLPHRVDPPPQLVDLPLARFGARHHRHRLDFLQQHGDRRLELQNVAGFAHVSPGRYRSHTVPSPHTCSSSAISWADGLTRVGPSRSAFTLQGPAAAPELDLERHLPVALVARQHAEQRLDRRAVVRRHRQADGHRARGPLPHQLDRDDLARQQPAGLVVALEPAPSPGPCCRSG